MRTIQLMNAYFNMNNMFLGRMAMKQAEKQKMIQATQFGSRKLHQAIDALLIILLIMNLSFQMKTATTVTPQDNSQCYDRLNHPPTSLAMRATGIPDAPVISMMDTLQRAEHHVLTAYGVSEDSYGGIKHTEQGNKPLGGIGQGNAAGPCAYANLAARIDAMCVARGSGATLIITISK